MFKKNDPNRKKKWAAIFILVLFLGSSISIAIIDAFSSGFKRNEEDAKLPEKLGYSDINENTKALMINNGFMIITYNYPESCEQCNLTIQELNTFVQDKVDAYAVALKGSNETLEIRNLRDLRKLNTTNMNELFNNYCEITYNKYDDCVLKTL